MRHMVGTAHETDGGHGPWTDGGQSPKLNDSKLNILLDFQNTDFYLYRAGLNHRLYKRLRRSSIIVLRRDVISTCRNSCRFHTGQHSAQNHNWSYEAISIQFLCSTESNGVARTQRSVPLPLQRFTPEKLKEVWREWNFISTKFIDIFMLIYLWGQQTGQRYTAYVLRRLVFERHLVNQTVKCIKWLHKVRLTDMARFRNAPSPLPGRQHRTTRFSAQHISVTPVPAWRSTLRLTGTDLIDRQEIIWGSSAGTLGLPMFARYRLRFPTFLFPQLQIWHRTVLRDANPAAETRYRPDDADISSQVHLHQLAHRSHWGLRAFH